MIKGYIGDGSAKPVFEGASPFNILGTGYQRPFELATLRLRNMISVLSECEGALPYVLMLTHKHNLRVVQQLNVRTKHPIMLAMLRLHIAKEIVLITGNLSLTMVYIECPDLLLRRLGVSPVGLAWVCVHRGHAAA